VAAGAHAERGRLAGILCGHPDCAFRAGGHLPDIVKKINADANRILRSQKVREVLEAQGAIPGSTTPVEMDAFLKAEISGQVDS
jgi:tripartite-type tricarboxylate transporter receptor subunit TctC